MKKIFIFGFIAVLLAAIPLTIYLLQQQQETRSRATAATTVSFDPPSKTVAVNDTFTLDIMVDPGSNLVTFTKIFITYDPTKIATSSSSLGAGVVINQNTVSAFIDQPVYAQNSIMFSISEASADKFIQTKTKIATIILKALAPTDSANTQIAFDASQMQVLSSGPSDQFSENVLSTTNGSQVTITPVSSGGTPTSNQPPVCTALNVDRAPSGPAPFAITFTAIGNDPNGTIQSVAFNFGDGPTETITQAGGIGTNSVNVQKAHNYQNPNTYKASVVLTDNQGGVSTPTATCTQTITVTQPTGNSSSNSAAITPVVIIATVTPTPTSIGLPPPQVSITPPGPGDTIVKIGTLGVMISIIGGLLFLAL